MAVGRLEELIELLDGLPVPAFLTELDSRKIVALNQGAADLLDSSPGDLLGTDILTDLDPEDRKLALRANRAMADRSSTVTNWNVRSTCTVRGSP